MVARNTDLIQKQLQPPHVSISEYRIPYDILDVRSKNSNPSVLFQFYKAKSGNQGKHGTAPNEEKSEHEEGA